MHDQISDTALFPGDAAEQAGQQDDDADSRDPNPIRVPHLGHERYRTTREFFSNLLSGSKGGVEQEVGRFRRQGRSQDTREMIALLQLIPAHENKQLRSAVEQALAYGSSERHNGAASTKARSPQRTYRRPLLGTGVGFERPMPRLDVYDQLLSSRQGVSRFGGFPSLLHSLN